MSKAYRSSPLVVRPPIYHFSGPRASLNPPLPLLLSLPRLFLSYDENGTAEVEDEGVGTGIGEVVELETVDVWAAAEELVWLVELIGARDEGDGVCE
ncbi:uncharacterized protein TERG_04876 [Trichophyton rubrum CBS 118892]|uniref:Uncharacterized protein n=1 Tax=Trichophyton rubrum (strain ATCC MYA-4607 / CBS 118892) TaxID=559305 RepID=F2SQL1_TRIRC|nr:uncharacterized protein TERG_04876 [Trichophyton rubrum CBS 118892]EGD88629.2 hypothetical protein TERG_04876 [Trichophyton rubrum CBS 118892]